MVNVLTLLLLNIVFFVCNIYPKHIIEINNPVSIAFNLIYYILFALFLIISINKNKNIFSEYIFFSLEKNRWKPILIRISLICGIKISFDIIILFLPLVLNENTVYLSDIFTVLLWIAFYSICASKEENVFRKRKRLVPIAIIITTVIITTYINYCFVKEYSLYLNKYDINFVTGSQAINNLDFLFTVKNFLLDTIIGLTLLISHFKLNKILNEKSGKAYQILHTFLLLVFAFVIISVKILIFPSSYIKNIYIKSSESHNYTITDAFSTNTKITVIERTGDDFSQNPTFLNTSNKLFYGDTLIFKYNSTDDLSAHTYNKNGNQIIVEDRFEKIDGKAEFYLYKNEVVCYLQNGLPIAFHSNSVQKDHSEQLTDIYKTLIENHYWNFFEQGAEYLLGYDANFIKPYLERYSANEFEEEEIRTLDKMFIKSQYIQRIAKKLAMK